MQVAAAAASFGLKCARVGATEAARALELTRRPSSVARAKERAARVQ